MTSAEEYQVLPTADVIVTKDDMTPFSDSIIDHHHRGRSDEINVPATQHDHQYHNNSDTNIDWGDEDHGEASSMGIFFNLINTTYI